jgi:hypothetical protein
VANRKLTVNFLKVAFGYYGIGYKCNFITRLGRFKFAKKYVVRDGKFSFGVSSDQPGSYCSWRSSGDLRSDVGSGVD